MDLIVILIATFSMAFVFYLFSHNNNNNKGGSSLPPNPPFFRTILYIFSNLHRFHDSITEILQKTQGTFMCKGPWFFRVEGLVTADPANVQYILSKRHEDFHKGSNFNQIFEIFGDGIFNSESDKWKYQRKIAASYLASASFHRFMSTNIYDKLQGGLIPLLETCRNKGLVIDLQDIFGRYSNDIAYKALIGHDPNELSLDSPKEALMERVYEIEEAWLFRHILPEYVWKLQKWLRVGKERKLLEAKEALYEIFNRILTEKRSKSKQDMSKNDDMIGFYLRHEYGSQDCRFKSVDNFLTDTFINFLQAGAGTITTTLTWVFWLLIKYPRVEAKIRDELAKDTASFTDGSDLFQIGNSKNLVYLHATLLEALRLFPPVSFNHKAAKQQEMLPSGHVVSPNTMVIISLYAMARMKRVWGDDCDEFKPERWITKEGTIEHAPSHKLNSFGTGPRMCLGKELVFVQVKAVVCHVLRHNYRFEVLQGHRVELAPTLALMMKHGLRVKVMKNV